MQIIDVNILLQYRMQYLFGFINTLEATLLGLIGSILIGALVASCRISSIRAVHVMGTVYIEFFRNIPLLITVFFFYVGLPALGIPVSGFAAGTLGLSIYTGALMATAMQKAIQDVPKGHLDAARSTGLSNFQAMKYVILPQVLKNVGSPLGNQLLNLIKNSSILGIVAGADLMYQAGIIHSETVDVFSTYFFVGLFYLILTIPLSLLVRYMEKRLARSY